MKILPASQGDAENILGLQKLAYQQEARIYNNFSIPPLTQSLKEIEAAFDTHVFLKAVDGCQIVGSVRAFSDGVTCFIGRLIVMPEHQGKGIGTSLMAEIENTFRDCSRYELFTGAQSQDNIRLYGRLGYTAFSEKRTGGGLTLIYLEKTRR